MVDPETAGALALLGGFFAAAGAFAERVFGKPEKRMKHREKLEQIEGATEAQIATAKAVEVEGRVSSTAVTALAQRCEAMEAGQATIMRLLDQQSQKTELLSATNVKLVERVEELKGRVAHLEQQLRDAGLVHTADLATISNLREELDSHVLELVQTREALAERDERIAALEARVAELEEALRDTPASKTKAKAAKKKGRNHV